MDANVISNNVVEVQGADSDFFLVNESKYFTIDDATRKITPPKDFTYLGVESDSNSKRIWFECPRFVGDNLDLTELNVYINYQNANGDKDRWHAEDVTIDGDKIHFSWKLSRKVLKYKGTVKFIVCALETDTEGEKDPEWNTTLCQGTVLEGLEVENPEPPEEEYDLINQLLSITKNSIAEVENISAQTKADIEASRLQALSDVESTQDKAVEAVESAKEGVLEYIGTGIDNTLSKEGVAAEAKETGDRLKTKGSVILNEASGNLIALADSDEAEFRGMKIFGKTKQFSTTGKNKLPYPYEEKSRTEKGIQYVVGTDGSVTLNGTSTAITVINFYLHRELALPAGTYRVGGDGVSSSCYVVIYNSLSKRFEYSKNNPVELTLAEEATIQILIQVDIGATLTNAVIKPFIVEKTVYDGNWEPFTGGIPSPNPNYPQALENVGDSGSVEQVVCGKNLLDVSSLYGKTTTQNGGTITCKEDGGFVISGTPTGGCSMVLITPPFPNGVYTMSLHGNAINFQLALVMMDANDAAIVNFVAHSSKPVITFDTSNYPECTSIRYEFKRSGNNIEMSGTAYCQIEPGEVTNPVYEPFKTSQSLTIPTPNGLPGVPVSSGGNYTDENGQQWICDYKDYERGVYVQRMYKLVLDGSENWSLREYNGVKYLLLSLMPAGVGLSGVPLPGSETVICTHALPAERNVVTSLKENTCGVNSSLYFHQAQGGITYTNADDWKTYLTNQYEAGTPVIVCYRLAEPIETPLSEEEIEAYKALHTNYPVTTIYNGEGAHTEVEYAADTKNYIDNKFAELQANILNATE